MWKRIAACILAAAVMAGTFCGTALAEPGEITPGWNRKGTDWYYYREDGSLLRNGDTPDGYRVDDGGKFAGTALGNGPWPVLETELLEEKAAQETEMARLYAIVHPSENPQRGIISQPVQLSVIHIGDIFVCVNQIVILILQILLFHEKLL